MAEHNSVENTQAPTSIVDTKPSLVLQSTVYYEIVARHSSKCADVADASQENNIPIVQFDRRRAFHQQWRIVPVGEYVAFPKLL